ncbi:MAG TPA: glycosyltransferase family 2 protein [Candidatus Acidoferrales bacterium]|nr:glycosyltransferase family 2 protein [Candidatus Acidoferrales bacterium]
MELRTAIATTIETQSSAPPEGGAKKSAAQAPAAAPGWKKYVNRFLAAELSALTRYYDRLIQWLPREDDTGMLLAAMDAPIKQSLGRDEPFPDLSDETDKRTAILINGTFNHVFDIQALLTELKPQLSRTSRVLVVLYNPYLRWMYNLANRLRIRKGELPSTFLTRVDLRNIVKVSGFAIVRDRLAVYFPWRLLGLGDLINRVLPLVPLLRWFSLTSIVVLRPLKGQSSPGLSCVIPARNERGNIENALKRFPDLGCETEIIFVEGHSTDGTWEEIQRVAPLYAHRFRIQSCRQSGKGKADAVRLGFSRATQPLLVILDADLTMPPEMLGRFYAAYCQGYGDFINGSRLVYPMEGEAMRFLNRLGNIFFAKMLSAILDMRLGDSLCGTKLLTRSDYQRMMAWRQDFGDFDPFGDFELLFPAAVLGLGIVDIPVRYLARTYGETNIQRFRHGLQLLKMTIFGLFRIKMRVERRKR